MRFWHSAGFLKAENDTRITMCCVFDNEEVGSATKQGAESTMLSDVLHRIADSMGKSREKLFLTNYKRVLLSADNEHAVHPNHRKKRIRPIVHILIRAW